MTRIQAVRELGRLVEQGCLLREGRGRGALYEKWAGARHGRWEMSREMNRRNLRLWQGIRRMEHGMDHRTLAPEVTPAVTPEATREVDPGKGSQWARTTQPENGPRQGKGARKGTKGT